jgi:hypothetical protein
VESDGAVRRALPRYLITTDRDFERGVFRLVRELRAVAGRVGPAAVEAEVQAWYGLARPALRSGDGCRTWDEVRAQFLHGWGKVKYAAGDGPVDHAYRAALAAPPPPAAARYGDERLRNLVRLCAELDRREGGQFRLSGYTAADLIGVSRPWADRWLAMLVADGVLRLARKADGPRRLAAEYQFIYDDCRAAA